MKFQAGFMLLHFCIYLMIFALITTLTMGILYKGCIFYRKRIPFNARIEDIYAAQDVFMYDMRRASSLVTKWIRYEPHTISWRSGNDSIEWYIKNNNLMRACTEKNKRYVSKIVSNIEDVLFEIQMKDNCMHMISLRIKIRGEQKVQEFETTYGFYNVW